MGERVRPERGQVVGWRDGGPVRSEPIKRQVEQRHVQLQGAGSPLGDSRGGSGGGLVIGEAIIVHPR